MTHEEIPCDTDITKPINKVFLYDISQEYSFKVPRLTFLFYLTLFYVSFILKITFWKLLFFLLQFWGVQFYFSFIK